MKAFTTDFFATPPRRQAPYRLRPPRRSRISRDFVNAHQVPDDRAHGSVSASDDRRSGSWLCALVGAAVVVSGGSSW
jgi:hypothetical protein